VSGTDITASGAVSAATVTGAAVATQANQETASATNLIVTPGRQQFHPSAAKAWGDVLINGTLNASYNVSGVVKDSTGDWTVSFTTAFSAANYAVVVTARNANASAVLSVPSKATGSFTVKAQNTSGTDVDVDFFFVCYGDQ
jgi:hypothetical protein